MRHLSYGLLAPGIIRSRFVKSVTETRPQSSDREMFQSTAELGTELDQEGYLMQQNSEVPIMQMSGFEGENKQ